eukprot:CAMPEP_0114625566 /NCGR_PEP_ID=MMETSP0168-20121206/11335_1 /TAXON_ID=95228 ORGANISM="Vannella sp., Strain DIVA3 517/6/12" /NCGR_SAMPLE_ID=MMETSP0168 /ASSEMBLY_ACC=CAM_ASM_000044 /LENGTH=223 /DNA_ID=CAMNT_0001836849 /DNA_START=62 /DNA_END=729 /DNA_ORIENTATION=-
MGGDDGAKGLPARNELHLLRKVFHAFNGLMFATVYYVAGYWLSIRLILALAVFSWFLEAARLGPLPQLNQLLIRLTGGIMRASEVTRPSGICFFATGVLVTGLLFSQRTTTLAILYLGLGDPFASAVGILVGPSIPALRMPNGKSLAGTAAAWALNVCVTLLYLGPEMAGVLPLAVLGGLVGALTELAMPGPVRPKFVDDNFNIPIASGIALHLLSAVLLDEP